MATRLLLVTGIMLLATPAVSHADQVITSAGPLSRIIAGADNLQCQVYYEGVEHSQFYGGDWGSCGTYLGVGGPSAEGGSVYGYNEDNCARSWFSPHIG